MSFYPITLRESAISTGQIISVTHRCIDENMTYWGTIISICTHPPGFVIMCWWAQNGLINASCGVFVWVDGNRRERKLSINGNKLFREKGLNSLHISMHSNRYSGDNLWTKWVAFAKYFMMGRGAAPKFLSYEKNNLTYN